MLNSMKTFACPFLDDEYPFYANSVPKNLVQNSLFKIILGVLINSNKLNSMVMLKFFLWPRNTEYHFLVNSIEIDKIIWLRWNLVPRLTQICWILMVMFICHVWTIDTFYRQICTQKLKLFIFYHSTWYS